MELAPLIFITCMFYKKDELRYDGMLSDFRQIYDDIDDVYKDPKAFCYIENQYKMGHITFLNMVEVLELLNIKTGRVVINTFPKSMKRLKEEG